MGDFLLESLARYTGQTVTIFTASGGLSGSGFTGVLAGICDCTVKLITDIGAPPACPVGSACCGGFPVFDGEGGRGGSCWNSGWGAGCNPGRGGMGGRWGWRGFNWLGSVTEIPIDKIVSFTHNAI